MSKPMSFDAEGAVNVENPSENLQSDTVFTDQNQRPLDMSEQLFFDGEGATNVINPSQILPTPEPPRFSQPSLKRLRKREADKRYRDNQKQKTIDLENQVGMLTKRNKHLTDEYKRINKKCDRLKKSNMQSRKKLNRRNRLVNEQKVEIHKLSTAVVACQICNDLNHRAFECPCFVMNQTACQICNDPNHRAIGCPRLVMNLVACQICNDPNHRDGECLLVSNGFANQTNISNPED